jgi:hypothetical protein
MDVGVTDSAVQNLDSYVVRADISTRETQGSESLGRAGSRVSLCVVHRRDVIVKRLTFKAANVGPKE